MSAAAALRARAVDFLRAADGPVAGPVLAEAIGADADDLQHLLAYPVALNLIRCWRVGPVWMWAKSHGVAQMDGVDTWPIHQSVVRVEQESPIVFVKETDKEGESHDSVEP